MDAASTPDAKSTSPTAPGEPDVVTTPTPKDVPPAMASEGAASSALLPSGSEPRRPLWRRIASEASLVVVIVSLAVVFAVFVLGMKVPGFEQSAKEEKPTSDKKSADPVIAVKLVKDIPHTLEVPEEVRTTLQMRKGEKDLVAVAQAPTAMRPLILPGSTMLDPTRLARIRIRFAPARVVKIGKISDLSEVPPSQGSSALPERELRPGDHVRKGQLLGIFYSDIVGSKKNDLLDALVQLELDQKILDRADDPTVRGAVPDVLMDTFLRAVYGDRNGINRAFNNLLAWDIPQNEIDELQAEAHKIAANKNEWYKTPAGRWVKGDKGTEDNYRDNPWGKVTLVAPFDGVIVERNLHVDEIIVDNTVIHFQIADVSRLLVTVNCPEDQLPALVALGMGTRWAIRGAGAETVNGLPGTIEEISYIIDPNQHTAVIKGYVNNPGERLRAGQYVTATVQLPPPPGVVEIPLTALVDDGKQSLVFVQTDPSKFQYIMRRVQVTHRFEKTAFVRSTPIPKDEQLTEQDAEEGLLPKEALHVNERIIKTGTGELKLALMQLESKMQTEEKQNKAKDDKR
jgi:cobalt-zinc-cadmium efflux system membrane fusion protein